jgi:hypothetical protein
MRLSQRSYPHPVVGNRDDVPGAAFQGTVEMSSDKQNIYLDVTIACSSATINDLVAAGRACFVLHVECSNTMFRRAYDFTELQHRVPIPAEMLNDAVEVNIFVRGTDNVSPYRVEKAHLDYADSSFEIAKNDILAVGEGRLFFIDSNFDSLSRIGSIMQIQEAAEDGDLPLRAEFNGDKIILILAKKDFADYKLLKADETIIAPLTATIVLPVLVEALHILKHEEEQDDELRWMRALRKKISALGGADNSEPLILAQRLLELPVRRALACSRALAGN